MEDRAKSAPPAPPALPWLAWPLGAKVSVRRREADGYYDAVGILRECSAHHLVVQTRRGPVRIEAAQLVRGRLVPDPAGPPATPSGPGSS